MFDEKTEFAAGQEWAPHEMDLIAAVIDYRRDSSPYIFREEDWAGTRLPSWAIDTLRRAFSPGAPFASRPAAVSAAG
ncbi:MAG TPA: hypothetical protein VJ770_19180 [Stellaceae bacterium]|nr:hypothetical protein [Stellaceae bacterium]